VRLINSLLSFILSISVIAFYKGHDFIWWLSLVYAFVYGVISIILVYHYEENRGKDENI
jgi:hypothetical protein